MQFYLRNVKTSQFASKNCSGEHDGNFTESIEEAATFGSWREASDFSQNFSGDWEVWLPRRLISGDLS